VYRLFQPKWERSPTSVVVNPCYQTTCRPIRDKTSWHCAAACLKPLNYRGTGSTDKRSAVCSLAFACMPQNCVRRLREQKRISGSGTSVRFRRINETRRRRVSLIRLKRTDVCQFRHDFVTFRFQTFSSVHEVV